MIPSFEEVMAVTRTVSSPTALEDIEALALYECCAKVPPGGLVVEIGCELGRSSSLILQVGKAVGYWSVHVDPYTEHPEYKEQWKDMMIGIDNQFTFLNMTTEVAAGLIRNFGAIDLAYIDGDHEKNAVQFDLRIVAQRVKVGGFLLAHDYTNEGLPGVRLALNEYIHHPWSEVGVFGSLGVWRVMPW